MLQLLFVANISCLVFSQTASQSQSKHNEADMINGISKTANMLAATKRGLFKHVNKFQSKEEVIISLKDNDSIYLNLSGNEEECVFSSTAPETKPTINVSYVLHCIL